VKVQQLHAVQHVGIPQALQELEGLAGGEPELGLLAAGVLPLALADGGQAHAHAQHGAHAQIPGRLHDAVQLRGLLDDDVDPVAQQPADQGQAQVLPVLVAIAHDHAAGARECQHRHQLRLAARLQAHPVAAGLEDLLHHGALLVHLDGVDGGVVAGKAGLGPCVVEGLTQAVHPVGEDVLEADQHRQA